MVRKAIQKYRDFFGESGGGIPPTNVVLEPNVIKKINKCEKSQMSFLATFYFLLPYCRPIGFFRFRLRFKFDSGSTVTFVIIERSSMDYSFYYLSGGKRF